MKIVNDAKNESLKCFIVCSAECVIICSLDTMSPLLDAMGVASYANTEHISL
ncbi:MULTISPECIES: huazacin family RiPP peptide [Marinitoga]|uniref:Uncharacterized protein n=1 Tax=Marinitoga hydrogenitolerans (strain DSM 16785 / JCM 12826 / AT1271) TaxID=1122195 RepID=A0A1M5AB09_MARH1|nr:MULTISPECIES: huazacin family RiPP peptide [Marinitoga]KLO22274.1 hypothetical protein X274_09105 [Marinitoga sp. 1155]SHF27355.1 hypothetical protein SAMN02745164_02145 [Marinitoga hydrogenitolerans DSM 16785]